MKYSLHLAPITLPDPQQHQTASISDAHQHYLAEQARAYQHFLHTQQQLWQNLMRTFNQATITPITKQLPGPKFSRQDLEQLSSGKIAPLFGEWFAPLDHYQKLIRMPEPPLLLADRVTGIDAEPGSMGKGTIWTETDVHHDSWYLHQNRMPTGIMIESGQADLLLISWLGLDFHNQGERVYRLLGCELTYFGPLPKPGDTLCFDIHVDGHAKQDDIRLFFFHYDCHINGKLLLSVRHGQAGFFTYEELANSGGVLWDAKDESCDPQLQFDSPKINCQYQRFSLQQIQDFSQGKVFQCFGTGFESTLTHTRSPNISGNKLFFLHEITDFNLQGGPWQRGYMRAIQNVSPDDWFFKGHFKNDPCMPGTLMLEAGLQLMAFYMTALGYTLDKDGWRFEPVTNIKSKLQCRGQVIPTSKQVVYEIFISSIVAEPIPMIFADLLGTVDGLKAFHTKIGLRLIPDWPLTDTHPLLKEKNSVPYMIANHNFDYRSLLACAWGKPSDAFGNLYLPFDNERRVPRLPGPPYHFMSRIADISYDIGSMSTQGELTVEYHIEKKAWYFQHNPSQVIPFCVLMEIALQPCGWLASYLGCALTVEHDLRFRNLDGTGILHHDVINAEGVLTTKVQCTNISQSAGMILVSFKTLTYQNEKLIYEMNTGFGFFQDQAFANQVGLTIPEIENQLLQKPANFNVNLRQQNNKYSLMPKDMLLMIDRVTGYWPSENKDAIAYLRAEKTVLANDWFFKAHFFQDPVQPGSLGVEAILQLLQFYMIEKNLIAGIANPRFEALGHDAPLTWKYRGQVVPTNNIVTILLTVLEEKAGFARANAALYVDGKRIYEVKNVVMKVNN